MYQFSVLIQTAPDVEGQWLAHCLNLDLVTQGNSPGHVAWMMAEALVEIIEDDFAAGADPVHRHPAPRDSWELFFETQSRGSRVDPANLDEALRDDRHAVVAATMHLEPVRIESANHPTAAVPLSDIPPPFMIAAMPDNGNDGATRA